jgi:RNA-binding protein
MKELSPKQKAFLKSQGQGLDPRLQIGKNGLTESFLKELDVALERDELVKVKVGKYVDGSDALVAEAASKASAALVATLGRTALYYRASKEPRLVLPV